MIVGCTGHRPQTLGGFKIPNITYTYVCEQTKIQLKNLKPEKCISGMALGFDQWFAKICIELNIPFIAAVPFLSQEKIWPKKSRKI